MRSPLTFRLALRLLPRSFRGRHRAELELALGDQLFGRSALGRVWVVARATVDVLVQSARLHWRGLWGRPRRSVLAHDLRLDLAFAARSLARRPAFAWAAAGVLAVGIGSATIVFSVVHGVLLRPLPYHHSDRIGVLWHDLGVDAQSHPLVNPLDLYDYRTWSREFESFTFAEGWARHVVMRGQHVIADVAYVEAGFFEFFGVSPLLGRSIRPEDDVPGAPPVTVVSHRFWLSRLGGDPAALGTTIEVQGFPTEVVGILPRDFTMALPYETIFLMDADLWSPAVRTDPTRNGRRTTTYWTAFARLREGVGFDAAQEDLDRMTARLREAHPEHRAANTRARIVPFKQDVVKRARSGLVFLFAAVGLFLLMACANVANLSLTRVLARRDELWVRAALGAGRGRVVRLVMMESVLVVTAAAASAVALSPIGIRAVRWLGRESLPRADALMADGLVLAFTLGVSALAVLATGLLPALRATAGIPSGPHSGSPRASVGRSARRFREGLIVLDVALSVALLVGTGLMVRTFRALQQVDPGYSAEGVRSIRASLPRSDFPTSASRRAFLRRAQARLSTLSGVGSASAVTQLPLTGPGFLQPYAHDEATRKDWESVTADQRWVAPGYFDAVGATLIAGHDFSWEDLEGGAAIVIDDELAEIAFQDRDPVGQRLQMSPNGASSTVIGVVSHLHLHSLARTGFGQIYRPMTGGGSNDGGTVFTLVLRTDGSGAFSEDDLVRELEALAPGIALGEVRPMEALVARALLPTRALVGLMTTFGAVALLVSAIGLYAVLAFVVGQRTREIGIRVALGARPISVQRSVLMEGARWVLAGLVVGLSGAALGARLTSSLLYEVRYLDPPTYASASVVLLAAALLACWLPARRAARIDPVEALRLE